MTIDADPDARNELRIDMSWRVALAGGAGYLLTALVSRSMMYGADIFVFMLPASSLATYFGLLVRSCIVPGLVIGLTAAIMAPHLQRYALGVQTAFFGVLLGVGPALLVVGMRLVVGLASEASLQVSWPAFFGAVGREIVWGIGLQFFFGAIGGWFFASLRVQRKIRTQSVVNA